MGIQNLTKLIKEFAPDGIETRRLEDFKGTCLAIDVSNYMYQFCYNLQTKKPNNHLAGFFQLVYELANYEILPVMIFDGKPIENKNHILEKRKDEKNRKLDKIAELQQTIKTTANDNDNDNDNVDNDNDTCQKKIDKIERQIIEVDKDKWQEIRDFLRILGVPVIQAPYEADILASQLSISGQVAGIISEDTDHLTFGAKCLIRDFNNKRNPDLQVYNLDKILSGLDMTLPTFMEICILCGCDYTPKITGIAWKRAYKLIKELGSINNIIEAIQADKKGFTKFHIPEEFDYEGALEIFQMCITENENSSNNLAQINVGEFQQDQVKNILMDKCNYRETTLTDKFEKIAKMLEKHK